MTERTEEFREFRWKITMSHGGQYSYGTGFTELSGYIYDCYRRGICFRVELKDLKEPDELRTWKQKQGDPLGPYGDLSRDGAVGLPDVELDEAGT